jgi:predicted Fe-S protein YdhL (DUF1289 family)
MPRSNRPPGPVPDPCTDVCRSDSRGLCIGCRRTDDEIRTWAKANEAWRWNLLRQLASRKKA